MASLASQCLTVAAALAFLSMWSLSFREAAWPPSCRGTTFHAGEKRSFKASGGLNSEVTMYHFGSTVSVQASHGEPGFTEVEN